MLCWRVLDARRYFLQPAFSPGVSAPPRLRSYPFNLSGSCQRREPHMSLLHDASLARLLADLHARSGAQMESLRVFEQGRARQAHPPTDEEIRQFRGDKLVALDRDKAEFCYQLCRATDARRIVEVGTSYGVSTLYLAAALRDNIAESGGRGLVIGTEYEPQKAAAASAHFERAGLSRHIELRQGDLRETLLGIDEPVDFLLVDIWIGMAR